MAVERGLGSPAKAVNRYSRLARKILTDSCSCIRNLWFRAVLVPGSVSFRQNVNENPKFESMAAAAQGVHEYFDGGKRILYINVMNNLSVDCDCDSHPADPQMKDVGILASLDPVALDKACLDLVFGHADAKGDDSKPLQERINRQHGTYIVDYAEQIGLGTRKYKLVNIDK